MISGPRNISTALLYAFDNRGDFHCFDEPFYSRYLFNNQHLNHPLQNEVIASQPIITTEIFDNILSQSRPKTSLFVKNMAHHIEFEDFDYWKGWVHLILIRDPARVLMSYDKVISSPTLDDIGIKQLYGVANSLEKRGEKYYILDTDTFLTSPKHHMQTLCSVLDIPYLPEMNEWKAGPRVIDGIWAPFWYSNVHQSTGISQISATKTERVPTHLNDIYNESLTYYEKLKNMVISL